MKSPVDLHIGNQLKNARTMAGLSQYQLSELIGITFQQIQKYEKGLNRISASRLYEISQILEQPMNMFFENYVPDPDYYSFVARNAKRNKPRLTEAKNKENLILIRSFNKVEDFTLRKNIIALIDSIAHN